MFDILFNLYAFYNKMIILSVTFYRDREQTSSNHRGERQGLQIGVGDKEVYYMYKISYKNILYNTGNIASIL